MSVNMSVVLAQIIYDYKHIYLLEGVVFIEALTLDKVQYNQRLY